MAVAQELLVRHARRGGREVAVLRATDQGATCVVEAEIFPRGLALTEPLRRGPYEFATAAEAIEFVEEAVRALMYLGCEVH